MRRIQPVLRRVLLPADMALRQELAAGGEWSASVSVLVTTGGASRGGLSPAGVLSLILLLLIAFMGALICGSLAFDTIATFEGRFARTGILPDQLHPQRVSFLVPSLRLVILVAAGVSLTASRSCWAAVTIAAGNERWRVPAAPGCWVSVTAM